MHLLVVFGGNSLEHEISILSLLKTYKGFTHNFDCHFVYLGKDNNFYLVKNYTSLRNINDLKDLRKRKIKIMKGYYVYKMRKYSYDYVYLLTHGRNVEDGLLNGYFNFLNIPLIGNNHLSLAISMDKDLTKFLVSKIVKSLPYKLINLMRVENYDFINELKDYPYVFKANDLGSSIGVFKVNDAYEALIAINNIKRYSHKIMIEKCLTNFKEYNMALYLKGEEFIYSALEVISNNDIYDYDKKYLVKKECDYILDGKLYLKVCNLAKKIYERLGFDNLVRVDFLYDEDSKNFYFNEVNAIPGSLSSNLFEKNKISLLKVINDLITIGINNYKEKILKINILDDYNFQRVKKTK